MKIIFKPHKEENKEEEKNNEKEITFEEEINQIKQKHVKKSSEENELKIELYPENIPKRSFRKTTYYKKTS